MIELERKVRDAALFIQSEIAKLENVHRFSFTVECEGRTDGDIKIAFRVGTDYDSSVVAGTITAALKEAMRRKGWSEMHAPIMISHVTGQRVTEE